MSSTADLAPDSVLAAYAVSDRPRHFLIVSAPFGPFSRRLAKQLREAGARCTRVLLNGGDVWDWGVGQALVFAGRKSRWPQWLDQTIRREGVTDLILFGDSNPYCAAALALAKSRQLRTHVFEEGYFRPFWITLEQDGVNGNSQLSRDPETYRREAEIAADVPDAWLPPLTPAVIYRICAYHVALYLAFLFFPFYRLTYAYSAPRQALGHILRYLGQNRRRSEDERRALAFLTSAPSYIALLQRPGDSQLLRHSTYRKAAQYIEHVVESFARHAPAGTRLLLKAHPLDHGLEPHERVVAAAAQRWGVADRVAFTDVGDLAGMLPAARGLVTNNSTGGLTAIERGVPTVTLGKAIYDLPGLTHGGSLDDFWTAPQAPDPSLYRAFRRVVMARTQINGAYATRHGVEMAAPEAARRLLA